MSKLDPITDGSKIFTNIFQDFGKESIYDINLLDKFLNRLLKETEGWVIVDFLDSGCWDCIGSYSIDKDKNYLTLNWHYYKGDRINSFIKENKYKPNISSILLHFKDMQLVELKNLPFITIRGYAMKHKEILSYLKTIDPDVKDSYEYRKNFYIDYELDRGEYAENCYCYNTPIYSIIIIPKDAGFGTDTSQKLLFTYNYYSCEVRLQKIQNTLHGHLDEDELCEKTNSIRRVFEFVLKIECCHHSQLNFSLIWQSGLRNGLFSFPNAYSDLTLGDLINTLKQVKSAEERSTLNQIVRLSNELSHDSGKPVTKEKVEELLGLATSYLTDLRTSIKF
ncbi:hypothetical protein LJ737_19095 [Hymenobacter sp. 15J16-1T3B]|uniref:hypothetical protein n=1 Tax=Hymenobacter sp. 15J16-1T3B TaxID=2886941 RepID=UPI001D128B2D|nr:hypothetical protein [Hymenobacter sp. 15J16-1T3B]MCC3159357.1 hypothetical protein [Hymenobacter sp. 15J16-1T3B]